jgi:hypothetical protein
MRKLAVEALAALLCAGLAASVAVADDADKDTPGTNKAGWLAGGWFASKPKVEAKKPVVKAPPVDETPPERAVDVRIHEQKAYLRRLQVCDRLLEIALDTNDAALQKQVEQLNQQAFDVYIKRTGGSVGGARFEEADGLSDAAAPKATPVKGKLGTRGEDKP